jgi:Lrp/AsnC family transcriptional regulator of lysine biosynthesis
MVSSGLIRKFTIEFGVKRGLKAFVLVRTEPKLDTVKTSGFFRRIPQVKSFYQLTGKWDIILRIFTESPHEFNSVIDRIRRTPWVMDTESLVVLEME